MPVPTCGEPLPVGQRLSSRRADRMTVATHPIHGSLDAAAARMARIDRPIGSRR